MMTLRSVFLIYNEATLNLPDQVNHVFSKLKYDGILMNDIQEILKKAVELDISSGTGYQQWNWISAVELDISSVTGYQHLKQVTNICKHQELSLSVLP